MIAYLRLFLAYQAVPQFRRASTFLEIAGFPHYENVCSNILQFYLDPQAEHGMGDLVLRSFLDLLGRPEVEIPARVEVIREYPIDGGQRIDLVITGPGLVIGIENKIRHWEANDLANYAITLDRLGKDGETLKLVLCTRIAPQMPAPAGGFVRRTYGQLWELVRSRMGRHLAGAPVNWIIHLNEFMETTLREAGETPEERELADFFMEHHALVDRLLEDRQRLLNQVALVVRELDAFLAGHPETRHRLLSRGIYQTHVLASHFDIGGQRIGLDLAGGLHGWVLHLFATHASGAATRDALMSSPAIRERYPAAVFENHSSYSLRRWNLHVSRTELEEALLEGFATLDAAAAQLA